MPQAGFDPPIARECLLEFDTHQQFKPPRLDYPVNTTYNKTKEAKFEKSRGGFLLQNLICHSFFYTIGHEICIFDINLLVNINQHAAFSEFFEHH